MKPKNVHKKRNATDYSPLAQQNWSFIKKSALAIPDKACENQNVMKSIHDMEVKSMNERILDAYEENLVDMIKAKTHMSEVDGLISPRAIPEDFMISFEDAKQLAISLNTIRNHTKEKLAAEKKSPTTHTHLPALDNRTIATNDSSLDDLHIHAEDEFGDVNTEELSHLDRMLLNFRTKSPRRNEFRDSFNSNPHYVDVAIHDEKIAKALIKSRAKISRQIAENVKAQIAEVQEQIVKTTIARKFKSYSVENGYRTPTCLTALPPLPGANNNNSSSNNITASSVKVNKDKDGAHSHEVTPRGSTRSNSYIDPVQPSVASKTNNKRPSKLQPQPQKK